MADKPHPTGHTPSFGVRPDPNAAPPLPPDSVTLDELQTEVAALQQSMSQLEAEVAAPWYAPYLSRKFLLSVVGVILSILASPAVTGLVSGPLAIKVMGALVAIFMIIEGAADIKSR